jgi:hypothetical protein
MYDIKETADCLCVERLGDWGSGKKGRLTFSNMLLGCHIRDASLLFLTQKLMYGPYLKKSHFKNGLTEWLKV